MLRSTGFFRGIECPFYTECTEGKDGRNGCNRPYCHFRHSQQRRTSYGATTDVKKQRDLHSTHREQGYDPFNPEVVRPQEQQNGKPDDSEDLDGALELVNKAIEEVRSEVEREKRKLSRIGDEPYSPSPNVSLSSGGAAKKKRATSHMAYDPGSYQITSGGYNPTPGCSKYTLDSDNQGKNSNSMEYVPTSVKKPPTRTHAHQPPSSPPTTNSSNSALSSKCKYTVDNSRPSTDMEYDPLSNYSAGITVKGKRVEVAQAVRTDGSKKQKLLVCDLSDEEYVVAVKKPQQLTVDMRKYTFSDSDGESSGTEYRPTSLSNLQQRKNNSGLAGVTFGKERKERTESVLNALTQKNKQDFHMKQKSSPEKMKMASRTGHEKSVKSDKIHKLEKDLNKQFSTKSSSSSSKDKSSIKSSNQVSAKKENKSLGKRDDRKIIVKEKTRDKIQKEGRDEKRTDGKIKAVEKVKTDLSKRDKDSDNGARESKKDRLLDKGKEHSKNKDHLHKNGKLDGSKREKDVKRVIKSCSHSGSSRSSSKGSSANSNKMKQNIGSSNEKRSKKRQHVSLSHADLFGDESPEEAQPIEVDDSDDDSEEVLVRKSADALKRGSLNKRKASELTPSSSDYEGDYGMEGSSAGKDEVDHIGIDFSSFQDELDFDSDPMEECLRIFNESKDVKKEDKGRQTKLPSRDSVEEGSTESTLTTLFPGQKKRVSHFVAKGNADAPFKTVRTYKRPTAQEVCYQRMQLAQQQAAQLSASVKTASRSSNPSFSGERKRIAHRPNPQITSSKSSSADAKSAVSRVLSPSQSHQTVKAQTTAGILSKTTSTVMAKRVAHTPTMKSTSMKRPIIPCEFGAKVPTNIRQRYLNTFIDECVKFCPSEDIAFEMALEEEKLVYDRSSSKNIYLNVAVNTLKKLRSKSSSCPSPATKEPGLLANRKAQSHEEVLGGRLAATTSFTVNRMGKQQEEKLSGATLYMKLKSYLMTEEQLQEHGYPRVNPEAPGKALIYNLPEKKPPADPFSKICCRCGAEYKINVNGNCVRKEECSHHWGRLRRHKVAGGWETSYNCCAAAVGAPGCQVAKQHVQDGRKELLDGYVSTFSKPLPPDGNGGVFALDCEMCYTKLGLELTRVTVIDSKMKVIYDTFVKPVKKVVDYNTRFSGVTEEDLENATITLRDVQAVLLSMFSADSILIGHSLESDLLALKLIHSSVIDTAIVFPHRLGLPYKRALRNLMADHLKRIIQDNVEGHDSSEDASACMELMMWKLKEDAKVKR
ncbi:RNA exonuclease 1-like [Solea senegalensis]|uniref:RNA exonuclease 1-like n=1 Tax=Solea senegalensis TaxID=28829 RepID=A0AAV6SD68_SOLSE|nr:RNA exonuclease 1 homolog [Solea senegalensis]KAG7514592.1 RNA exonuclease 1-like [Solea senegalensis]